MMGLLTVLAWIFGPIVAWLAVGSLVAWWDMDSQWMRATLGGTRRNIVGDWKGAARDTRAQTRVAYGLVLTATLWPARLLWLLAFHAAHHFDPSRLEQENAKMKRDIERRDAEIARLERLNNIPNDSGLQ